MHHPFAIDDHRHPPLVGLRQLILLGEAPRHRFDREPLMRQRHLRAPAERAEAAVRLGAGEIVHDDRHGGSSSLERRRYYGATLPRTTTTRCGDAPLAAASYAVAESPAALLEDASSRMRTMWRASRPALSAIW